MKITKTTFPQQSILNNLVTRYDFVDSFKGIISDPKNQITASIVGKAFFVSAPEWVSKLFTIRNKIVSIFGLKTSGDNSNRELLLSKFKCEHGEQLGLFKVFSVNETEVVLGENDSHLDFRISLLLEPLRKNTDQKAIILSTTVIIHNRLGRLYFLPVKQFHRFIAPRILEGIIKHLEKTNP